MTHLDLLNKNLSGHHMILQMLAQMFLERDLVKVIQVVGLDDDLGMLTGDGVVLSIGFDQRNSLVSQRHRSISEAMNLSPPTLITSLVLPTTL